MLISSRVCWALFIAAGRNIMMGGGGGELPEDSGMGVRPVSQNPYFIKEKKICYFPYLIYKTCPLSKRKCP